MQHDLCQAVRPQVVATVHHSVRIMVKKLAEALECSPLSHALLLPPDVHAPNKDPELLERAWRL